MSEPGFRGGAIPPLPPLPGFRGGAIPPLPPESTLERILRDLARTAAARELELPEPPAGCYWHCEQRLEDHPARDAMRVVVTWELREVH